MACKQNNTQTPGWEMGATRNRNEYWDEGNEERGGEGMKGSKKIVLARCENTWLGIRVVKLLKTPIRGPAEEDEGVTAYTYTKSRRGTHVPDGGTGRRAEAGKGLGFIFTVVGCARRRRPVVVRGAQMK